MARRTRTNSQVLGLEAKQLIVDAISRYWDAASDEERVQLREMAARFEDPDLFVAVYIPR
jgi:hypothetical protein